MPHHETPTPFPPTATASLEALLKLIGAVLRRMTWTTSEHIPADMLPDVFGAFDGKTSDGWRCTVAAFQLPAGGIGRDGAIVNGETGMVFHLTPELAELAVMLASNADGT